MGSSGAVHNPAAAALEPMTIGAGAAHSPLFRLLSWLESLPFGSKLCVAVLPLVLRPCLDSQVSAGN